MSAGGTTRGMSDAQLQRLREMLRDAGLAPRWADAVWRDEPLDERGRREYLRYEVYLDGHGAHEMAVPDVMVGPMADGGGWYCEDVYSDEPPCPASHADWPEALRHGIESLVRRGVSPFQSEPVQ